MSDKLRIETLEPSDKVLEIPPQGPPPKPGTVCIECASEDIKALDTESNEGTWTRLCNNCYASWGVGKSPFKTGWSSGFYTFHNTSAAVKELMKYG